MLDIEGTVAPISYVADVMFPYARDNVQQHLQDSYASEETQVGGWWVVGGTRRERGAAEPALQTCTPAALG